MIPSTTKQKISAGAGAVAGTLLLPGKGLFSLACKAVIGGATQTFLVPAVRSLWKPPKVAEMVEKKNDPKIKPLPLVFVPKQKLILKNETGQTWAAIDLDPQWKEFMDTVCYPNGPFAMHLSLTKEPPVQMFVPDEWGEIISKRQWDTDELTPVPITDEPSFYPVFLLEGAGPLEDEFVFMQSDQ